MKIHSFVFAAVALVLTMPLAWPAAAASVPTISGEYVEFRNADVFTGPCFANGEVNLTGEEAVMGWHVAQGAWRGVPLEGLSVAAVVRASATLGDPYANPLPAKTVFLVDKRGSDAQRTALVGFAQAQAAGLLNDVVSVMPQTIEFNAKAGGHYGWTSLRAGSVVRLTTRMIGTEDELCHNESVYYPPLAANLRHSMPVVAENSAYSGGQLGVTWQDSGRRSSFVATFAQ